MTDTLFDRFPECRVAVIGDVMLDCYLQGDVHRISPEAPVPVILATSERAVAGGAANVATNLASLGMTVHIVGLTGADEARDQLIGYLRAQGDIECSGLTAVTGRRTTKKLRIIGAHQQMVRIDYEDVIDCPFDVQTAFQAAGCAAIDACDVLVISDYGKGACSTASLRRWIDHARAAGKPVLVDPKRRDLSVYADATILTPNRKELSDATGLVCETDEEAAFAASVAQAACHADILLTRSEKGMSYFPTEGPPIHLATVAQDVFDVSGAGDTVVAVLAAAIAAGISMPDAMKMANHAAGIVVSKLGTAAVTREELAIALAAENAPPSIEDGSLLDLDAAVALRWSWADEKLTVGIANGCFDLLHPGHVSLIRQAAEACDRLIMALNSDESVRRLKGPSRPLQDQVARAEVIGAIKGVAAVILFDEDTPFDVIEALQPDVIIKGADYTEENVVGADIVKARGGRVVLAGLSAGHSTSRLVAVASSARTDKKTAGIDGSGWRRAASPSGGALSAAARTLNEQPESATSFSKAAGPVS